MKSRNEEIDQLFSNGLDNYEETPSANAWDQIEGQLPSKRNRTIYWVAASVAGVLLTAAIGWNSILSKSDISIYDAQQLTSQASYPEKEFIPVPILVQTKTIVYVDRPEQVKEAGAGEVLAGATVESVETQAALELQPFGATYALNSNAELAAIDFTNANPAIAQDESVTIIYKKGDPKYPKLAKALNFMKEVGEGERQLIDFEKISNNLMARRETNTNSNKN